MRRVGPGKLEIILLGWLPSKVVLDQDDRSALPAVVRAWVRWAARGQGVPQQAFDELCTITDELLEIFPDAFDDPANAGPAGKFLPAPSSLRFQSLAVTFMSNPHRNFVADHVGASLPEQRIYTDVDRARCE